MHPVKLPGYRLPHAYKEDVQEEIQEMLEQEVMEPSTSEWGAPIVIVKKKRWESTTVCRLSTTEPPSPKQMPTQCPESMI